MYHFVKFNKTWYLKPECIQDIVDHFNKICDREFKDGFEDFRDNVYLTKGSDGEPYVCSKNHSSSLWRYGVEMEMQFKDKSWLEAADSLERRTYKDRLDMFLKGRAIYFTDGIPYYCALEHPEYEEEVWSEELSYPYEYKFEDVRYMQWPGGYHWYAKVGNMDIGDKYGNYKFSDKSYAIKVAKAFCACGGDWSKVSET